MYNISTDFLPAQCAARSVGASNQFLISTIQTLIVAHCAITDPSQWPGDYGQYLNGENDEYDFIIAGGGTAGAIIAARLSENPAWNVLMLELGGDPPFESNVANMAMFMQVNPNQVTLRSYDKPENCCRLNEKGCLWLQGTMIGGSSGLGFLLYTRANWQNLHDWAALGNPGWDYDSVLPYFLKAEGSKDPQLMEENPGLHNANGPSIVEIGTADSLKAAVFQALNDSGAMMSNDLNTPFSRGYGRLQIGIHGGRRYGSAKSYLAPAKDRTNLHIVKDCFVSKIIMNGTRAVGVEYVIKNETTGRAYARKEVIVSAGSFGSVALLMRSGIGPSAELAQHNITPIVELPVGKNLIEHSFIHLLFKMNYTTTKIDNVTAPMDAIYNLLMHNTGGFSGQTYSAGHFNSGNISDYANHQRFFSTFPWGTPSVYFTNYLEFFTVGALNETAKAINDEGDLLIVTMCATQPISRGYVTLDNDTNHESVKIHSNLHSDPKDRLVYVQAIRQTFELFEKGPFQKMGIQYVPHPIPECDALKYDTDIYWDCFVRYQSSCGSHPTGTSRMGPQSDPDSVLNERGQFYGIEGLRQFDAGIIPVPLGVNTWANCVMLAEKGADMIKKDHCSTKSTC